MPMRFVPASPRVLVVEDDDAVREALADGLSVERFVVTCAVHGQEALALLQSGYLPDLIVLDLVMPAMDGWSLRVELRKRSSWARIPVIALSAEEGPQAEAIDAAAFLLKPVLASQVAALGRQLLAAAARERMEQMEKMASLGLLAAGLAHEINNPLAYTLANLRFILEEFQGLEKSAGDFISMDRKTHLELVRALVDAVQGADRVRNLVADLRGFTRSDAPTEKAVDLKNVAGIAIRLATPQTKPRVEIFTEFAEVPLVAGDEAKLVQLVLNLIVNAAQAIPTAAPRPARIYVRTGIDASGRNAFIEVEDTGEGIPPVLQERIFEPFFTTKPPSVGTGLGLAICRRIAETHGGALTVESELGKGSRFRLTLPLEDS